MPLYSAVLRHATTAPGSTAITIDNDARTYADVLDFASRLLAWLDAIPAARHRPWLAPGGRLVAVALANEADAAGLFVGASAYPHACAVLDATWPVTTTRAVLDALAPDAILTNHFDDPLVKIATALGLPWTTIADLPAANQRHDREPADGGSSAFLVGFTSGTTSLPKGFLRSRDSWRASLEAGREVFRIDATASTMAPGPLRHGLTLYALAECLFSGAAFHGTAKFEALQIARAIADTSVCRLVVVPSMLSALAPLFAQVIPNDLQSIIVAGSRLEGRLVTAIRAAVPSVEVIEYYGASELGFVSLRSLTSDPFPNSVGYAFPGVNIRTRAHGGRLCLPGEPGTIYVRSPLISDGYVFGDDGKGLRRDGAWATVGDSGILDLDGRLTLIGREGGMIITGGQNVFPEEIDSIVVTAAGVTDAATIGIPDDYLGQRLVCVVSLAPGAAPDHAALASHCAAQLPRYKIPRRFFAIDEWPRTTSGKIVQKSILSMLENRDARLKSL